MGDIIDSHTHDQNQLMEEFKTLIQSSNRKNESKVLSPLTITLGDEFQGVVDSIESGVAMVINLEEELIDRDLGFKIRYVLHEGKIRTEINSTQAYEMLGEGLTDARNELNQLKKSGSRFKISLKEETLTRLLNGLFKLLQHFIDSWSVKDRRTASGFLKGLTYKEVAKIEKKDESSLWRRRRSLAIDQYFTCKTLIYEAVG